MHDKSWHEMFDFFVIAGRDRDETEMIRKAVDAALDQLERRQEVEEMTDMKQIKEEIFLEIAKRLEQAKIDTAEVRQLLIWYPLNCILQMNATLETK